MKPAFSSGHRLALMASGALALLMAARAEDKKPDEKKPEPPRLALTIPLGLRCGVTNQVLLRGQRIKEAESVVLDSGEASIAAVIGKREEAKPPDGLNAGKVGDQSLSVEVLVPPGWAGASNIIWRVKTWDGEAKSPPQPVFAPESWVDEKEPNNGFREAQPLMPGQVLAGALAENADVDVYKINGTGGQTLKADLQAARLGSSLDAILTWYDVQGHILSVCDDAEGHDPVLRQKLPPDGTACLAVTVAGERAAKTHVYLLKISAEP